MYYSPKTPTDGLVFHYDTGNTVRSYLGEPTVNLAYAVNSYLNSNSNWWINAGNTVFSDNDTSIPKPVIPNVDTTNLRVFSSTVTQTGGNQQLGSSIVTVSPSTTYSFSIYFYFTGTTLQIPPYVRTLVNNDLLAYFAYNGSTNYLTWPRNQWILLKATVTTQANENGIYMSSYTGDTLGEKLAYFGYQVEQKSHCTPLVLGTRSATQGLKDLTAKNTIDLSNVSFDSNAQMTFDGTNDYIGNIPLNLNPNISGFTYETVLNSTIANTSYIAWKNLIGFGGGSNVYGILVEADARGYRLDVPNTSGTRIGTTTSINIPANTNTHIVWSWENGLFKFYINGTLQVSDNAGAYTAPTITGVAFGTGINVSNGYWYGQQYINKLYNRALTADEVQRNFNAVKSRFNIA